VGALETIIAAGAFASVVTFVIAFRIVTRDTREPAIPTAAVVDGETRWTEGKNRQRLIARANRIGPIAVAAAITSIAIMIICFAVIVVITAGAI
jgi:hypothetical protein